MKTCQIARQSKIEKNHKYVKWLNVNYTCKNPHVLEKWAKSNIFLLHFLNFNCFLIWEADKERKESSYLLVHFPSTRNSYNWNWSWNPGTLARCPLGVTGTQFLAPSPLTPRIYLNRRLDSGVKLDSLGTQMWELQTLTGRPNAILKF